MGKSEFVVNGVEFENDFEAALYIVIKSETLTVGSFYDEAVAEQRRLASSWKLALLTDKSLDGDSRSRRKRVKSETAAPLPLPAPPSLPFDETTENTKICSECGQTAEVTVQVEDTAGVPVNVFQCTTAGCHGKYNSNFVGWAPIPVKPNPPKAAQAWQDAIKSKAPSGQAIIAHLQRMKKGAAENRVCPQCGSEGTQWVHETAVLYICYNEECPSQAIDRIVGWQVKGST